MKRFVLISLLFVVFQGIYSQKVSNVDANQVGKKIEITYDLDSTADVSVECSTDGGLTYTKLHYVSGAVGRRVKAGHNSILWDVLAEKEQLVGDNICFRVNATIGKGYENGHEWVDLGLSVKWATCNIGASTPEAYGNYYAWGETVPKSKYMGSTYTYSNTPSVLPLNRDVASVNWGGNWRMPTSDEILELKEKCSWKWTGRGYKVTGPNGNSIFLPAAGNRTGSTFLDKGLSGCYWSSSFKIEYAKAYYIRFYSNSVYRDTYNRTYGKSVRAVLD